MASAMTSISYTQYECNTFKIGFKDSGATVLVDPWLVDELVRPSLLRRSEFLS